MNKKARTPVEYADLYKRGREDAQKEFSEFLDWAVNTPFDKILRERLIEKAIELKQSLGKKTK